MATTIQADKIVRGEYLDLKNRAIAELKRRGITEPTANAYTNSAVGGGNNIVYAEHYDKLSADIALINSTKALPDAPLGTGNPKNILITEAQETTADATLTAFEGKNLSTTISDCTAGVCTGTCSTTCTSCTGTCNTSCSGGCTNACSGCTASCKTQCSGECTTGCLSCTGCSGCLGTCSGGCTNACSGCTGGCQGCSNVCSSNCGYSCGAGCNSGQSAIY